MQQLPPSTGVSSADDQETANSADWSMQDPFASLVNRHSAMVLGVCRRMLGDADAEDTAQAVFILMFQKAMQIQDESRTAGWLHRAAQHVCRNVKRSRVSRMKRERKVAVESHTMNPEPADLAHWKEIREIIDEEVNRLPENLRIPFVLFHCENRSLAEVAELLGSTVSTVGTWLQRARQKLSHCLRKRRIVVGATALAALLSQHVAAEAVPPAFVATMVQTISDFSGVGMAACTPAVASLIKAGAASGLPKLFWVVSCLIAATAGFPLIVFWLLPALQTRQSPDFPMLQGEWREVASEQNGGPVEAVPQIEYEETLQIAGQHFQRTQTLFDGRVLQAGSGSFVLDSSQVPAAINFKQSQGTAYAIYKIDGDALTVCVTCSGGLRPNGFSTTKNDGRILSQYKKVR